MLRRAFLASAAAALALGLVACGGVAETLDPLAAAADKSAKAGGVRMELDATFSVAGVSASLSADGVFDGDEGELTMHMGDLLGQAGVPGDGELRMIVTKEGDRSVLYMQMPELAGVLPGGKSWLKADVDEAMSNLGVGGNARDLFGATSQSPAETLKLLGKAGSVTEVGTETVEGAETTHYRATVDLAEVLESSGAPAEAVAAVEATGLVTKVPIDVWIGVDDGYVHRLKISYAATAQGETVGGELTLTMSDWGSDVSIDVPDDDQVFDATQLMSMFGKS